MADTAETYKLAFFTPKMSPEAGEWLGVQKKIQGQLNAFSRLGFEVRRFDFAPYRSSGNPLTDLARNYTHNRGEYRRCLEQIIEFEPDALYIRYSFADSHFIDFLENLRDRTQSTLSVVLEIATYPYDSELSSLKRPGLFYLYLTDLAYRRKLRRYVDRIVTFSSNRKIFGIPTINISNGVDTQAIRPISDEPATDLHDCHFIGVSNLVFWTGFERMLHGLAAYQKSKPRRKVVFHIVGDGLERGSLQELAVKLGLTDEVVFHGAQTGDSLDRLFMGCQLAIGNLGVHRKGMVSNPDLKNREYCARGIPFVTSTIDPGFPEDFPGQLRLPADETPIDIAQLVAFVETLKQDRADYSEQIREYCVEHFDWTVMLGPVAEIIRKSTLLFIAHSADFYGAEKVLLQVIEAARKSWRVHVLLPADGDMTRRLESLDNVVLHRLSLPRFSLVRLDILLTVTGFVPFLYRFRRLLAELRPALVYGSTIRAAIPCAVARKFGYPTLLHYHECNMPGRIGGLLAKLADAAATRCLFVCRAALESYAMFRPSFGSKSRIVYNGIVPPTAIDDQELADEFKDAEPKLISIAQLAPHKRIDDLIEALDALRDRFPTVRLVVLGEGEQRRELENRCRELELSDHLLLAGYRKDIFPLLNSADIFLAPFAKEACNMAVLEAMALGKPVIAANGGGMPELVVDGETGFLFPVGDITQLAQQTLQLAESSQLRTRLGSAGRDRVVRNFNLPRQMDLVLQEISATAKQSKGNDA